MANDLKIGHYLKVPPRLVFFNQIIGTILGSIFNYIVNYASILNYAFRDYSIRLLTALSHITVCCI